MITLTEEIRAGIIVFGFMQPAAQGAIVHTSRISSMRVRPSAPQWVEDYDAGEAV